MKTTTKSCLTLAVISLTLIAMLLPMMFTPNIEVSAKRRNTSKPVQRQRDGRVLRAVGTAALIAGNAYLNTYGGAYTPSHGGHYGGGSRGSGSYSGGGSSGGSNEASREMWKQRAAEARQKQDQLEKQRVDRIANDLGNMFKD